MNLNYIIALYLDYFPFSKEDDDRVFIERFARSLWKMNRLDVLKTCIDKKNNFTILHHAIYRQKFHVVQFLVLKNYINVFKDFGPEIIHFTIKYGDCGTLNFLSRIYEVTDFFHHNKNT